MLKRRDEKELRQIEKAQEDGLHAYAAELGKRYVTMHPEDPEGYWLLGFSLHQLDRYAEAKNALETALPLCSSDVLAPVLSTLAEICRDTGDFANAEHLFTKAIEAAQEAGTYLDLCWMLQVLNRYDEAERCLRKGIDAEATPLSNLRLRLAEVLNIRGNPLEASENIAMVLEEEPENPGALIALEDARHLADLTGVELPNPKPSSKKKHHPGNLTPNIHREFFAAIASGRKKIEYRAATEFWQNRIEKTGEPPFHLRIINGMTKQAPELTVVVEKVLLNVWEGEYELHLGKVIDLKNWDGEKEAPTT